MKHVILAIVLTASSLSGAFAENDSSHRHIRNSLQLLFQTGYTGRNQQAQYYLHSTIEYKGMRVIAFKNENAGWYGFFKAIKASGLPADAMKLLEHKYSGSRIANALMYFDATASVRYFAEIVSGGEHRIVELDDTGGVKDLH